MKRQRNDRKVSVTGRAYQVIKAAAEARGVTIRELADELILGVLDRAAESAPRSP